jgi:hypothetical protein
LHQQKQHHHQEQQTSTSHLSTPSPLSLRQTKPVLYAFKYLNSPATQTQYPKRFKVFLDYLGLPGDTIEEQAQVFMRKAREQENSHWAEENIMLFLDLINSESKEERSLLVPSKIIIRR